jgi:hypothetical protein
MENTINTTNRLEAIFSSRDKVPDSSIGPLTSYAKRSLNEDEVITFNPSVYLPQGVIDELSKVSSLSKIFTSDHSLERMKERGMPHFHRLNFADCHAGQIDHRQSHYNQHGGKLLKHSYPVEIEKVKATYDPTRGKVDVVNISFRVKGIVGMGKDDEENKEPKNQLDALLVLDVKRGKKGDYVGVMVTGWMKAGDDYPPRKNYAVEQDFNKFVNKMDHMYRITKEREISAKRQARIAMKNENREEIMRSVKGEQAVTAYYKKSKGKGNSNKFDDNEDRDNKKDRKGGKDRGKRRSGYLRM